MTTISPQSINAEVPVVAEVALHPTDRDVILGEGSTGHKTNFLLEDLIRLHRILWTLQGKPPPTVATEIQPMVERIISIIQNGKSFELAGFADVPTPFMRSKGRFLGKDSATGAWKVLSDEEVNTILTDVILDAFKVDDLGLLNESPYSNLKEWINNPSTLPDAFLPEANNAIFFPVDQEEAENKIYRKKKGNKTLFHLTTLLVTSDFENPYKRVEAAFRIMRNLDGTWDAISKARFIVPTLRDNQMVEYHCMDPASAAEFTVILVFELFLEKEIHCTDADKAYTFAVTGLSADGAASEDLYADQAAISKPSLVPIQEPTDHDVLCERNAIAVCCHPGNRHFRDVIAIHRLDYIEADTMDKPAVVHKIVKAIRQGFPVGRFLEKGDDGSYYDVGDRSAVEMTTNHLNGDERAINEAVEEATIRMLEQFSVLSL